MSTISTSPIARIAATYSRFSSELQNQRSIDQQQAECQAAAEKNGHEISAKLQFEDEAVSGTKLSRTGLDAMLAAAEAGEFGVLYLYSLSRLARESVITLPLMKRLVYRYNVRVICVSDNIDTENGNWSMMVHFMAMQHERFITDLAAGVLRGQADNVRQNLSVGDFPLGYRTVAVSDAVVRGRQRKIPRTYEIDPDTSLWIKQIYDWFTIERRSISWIVRELNEQHAPKDHRSTTKTWRHPQVINVLRNRKYIGEWTWGKLQNKRDPETGQVWQEARDAEVTQDWTRIIPELQIIAHEQFELAQARLDEQAQKLGSERRSKSGKLRGRRGPRQDLTPKHLLNGLLVCAICQSPFHQGGAFGKYYFCPRSRTGHCPCKTTLQRERAERLVLEAVQKLLLRDERWVAKVFEATLACWEADNRTVPGEIAKLKRQLADSERHSARLVELCLKSDVPEFEARLKKLRDEKRELEQQLAKLNNRQPREQPPTRDEFLQELTQLHETLTSLTPAASYALRDLLGGKLLLEQIVPPGKKRGFLRGTLDWQIRPLGSADLGGVQSETLDFLDEPPQRELAVRAHELLNQGLLLKEVGAQLGLSKSNLTRLLKKATEYGLPAVAGKARRKTLLRKQTEPAKAEQLADQVHMLSEEGLLLTEIAERLGGNRDTVTAAKAHWYRSRGLPIPDGRTRRKTLPRKSRPAPKPNDDNQVGPSAAA